MDDPEVISLIRRHATADRLVFSVCTAALLYGAAGLLRDRMATTTGRRTTSCASAGRRPSVLGWWPTATTSAPPA